MANVANSIATGPASKDAVSGGKKFPLKTTQGRVSGGMPNLGTASDEAHRKIMGLKIGNPGNFDRGGAEATFKSLHAPRGKA